MKTDKKSLDESRKLLTELSDFENALDILNNFDTKAFCYLITLNNNNEKVAKDAIIRMPSNVLKEMKHYILEKIAEINEALKKM